MKFSVYSKMYYMDMQITINVHIYSIGFFCRNLFEELMPTIAKNAWFSVVVVISQVTFLRTWNVFTITYIAYSLNTLVGTFWWYTYLTKYTDIWRKSTNIIAKRCMCLYWSDTSTEIYLHLSNRNNVTWCRIYM